MNKVIKRHGVPMCYAVVALFLLSACNPSVDDESYVGYVEAELIYVASPQSGWLVTGPPDEGAEVHTGDVLFELDKQQQEARYRELENRLDQADAQTRDMATGARREEVARLIAQLHEAEAKLTLAMAEQKRWAALVQQGYASQARADAVAADVEIATARVEEIRKSVAVAKLPAREAQRQASTAAQSAIGAALSETAWQLEQRSIIARVGGRVDAVYHRKGEYVSAAAPVLAILPADSLKVRFFVPLDEVTQLAPGDKVDIKADGLDQSIIATISFIAGEAEFTPPVIYSKDVRAKLVFMTEAHLPAGTRLPPGVPVDVYLQTSNTP